MKSLIIAILVTFSTQALANDNSVKESKNSEQISKLIDKIEAKFDQLAEPKGFLSEKELQKSKFLFNLWYTQKNQRVFLDGLIQTSNSSHDRRSACYSLKQSKILIPETNKILNNMFNALEKSNLKNVVVAYITTDIDKFGNSIDKAVEMYCDKTKEFSPEESESIKKYMDYLIVDLEKRLSGTDAVIAITERQIETNSRYGESMIVDCAEKYNGSPLVGECLYKVSMSIKQNKGHSFEGEYGSNTSKAISQ